MLRQGGSLVRLSLTKLGVTVLTLLVTESLTSAICGVHIVTVVSVSLIMLLFLPAILTYRTLSVSLVDVEIPRRVLLGEKYVGYADVEFTQLPPGFKYRHVFVTHSDELDVSTCRICQIENNTLRVSFTLRGLHVGVYTLDHIKFMFVHVTRMLYLDCRVVISHSVEVEARSIAALRAILGGRGAAAWLGETEIQRPSRVGLEYFGSRPFMPGDDYRFIDWRATARTGKLHVKEFYSTGVGSIEVMLNLSCATSPVEVDELAVAFMSLVYSVLLSGLHVQTRVLSRNREVTYMLRTAGDFRHLAEGLIEVLTEEIRTCRRITSLVSASRNIHGRFTDVLVYMTTPREDACSILEVLRTSRHALVALVSANTQEKITAPYTEVLGVNVVCGSARELVYKVLDRLAAIMA